MLDAFAKHTHQALHAGLLTIVLLLLSLSVYCMVTQLPALEAAYQVAPPPAPMQLPQLQSAQGLTLLGARLASVAPNPSKPLQSWFLGDASQTNAQTAHALAALKTEEATQLDHSQQAMPSKAQSTASAANASSHNPRPQNQASPSRNRQVNQPAQAHIWVSKTLQLPAVNAWALPSESDAIDISPADGDSLDAGI